MTSGIKLIWGIVGVLPAVAVFASSIPVQPLNPMAESDSGSDRWVSLANNGAGIWVAVWSGFDPVVGNVGLASVSMDDGLTWGKEILVSHDGKGNPLNASSIEIATDRKGRWIATWDSASAMAGTTGNDSDLFYSISEDNGMTWAAAAYLNSNAEVDSGSDLTSVIQTDGAGTWVVGWWSDENLGGVIGKDFDLLFARSTDNGETWSDPGVINTDADKDSENEAGPKLAWLGGDIWGTVWSSGPIPGVFDGFDAELVISKSVDGGQTWGLPSLIVNGARFDGISDGFIKLAADTVGNVICVFWRWNLIYTAASHDFGETWDDPVPLFFVSASGGFGENRLPNIATDGNGNWIAAWESNVEFFQQPSGVVIMRSTDNGLTWEGPAIIRTENANFVEIGASGDGAWVVAWDDVDTLDGTIDDDLDILYTRFELPIGTGPLGDCDLDGIPDELEVDCNRNCIPDDCDILDGTSPDEDGDGVPDNCYGLCGLVEVFFDADLDGDVDLVDLGEFLLDFTGAGGFGFPETCNMDSDGDGDVDLVDFAAFQLAFTGAGG